MMGLIDMRRNRLGLAMAAAVLAMPAAASARQAAAPAAAAADEVTVELNVMVKMRDGVALATDVFRPAKPGRYPVILTRDPYDNGSDKESLDEGRRWAQRGYVFLHQDVRGRYDSDGTLDIYESEINDGYDSQMWAGQQPWSNGKIGMIGGSYLASVQWLSAPLASPYLVALAPRMSPFNYYQDVAYPGGAFSLGSRLWWAGLLGNRTNQVPVRDWDRITRHLPLATVDRGAMGQDLPALRDWIAHPSYDAFWQRYDVERSVGKIGLPVYNIAGWYDVFLRGNLKSYELMRKGAATPAARAAQRLIIGPWPHTEFPTAKLGDLDFGPESVVEFDKIHQRWLAYWLKGEANGIMNEPPVRLFVMGENKWRSEQEWPLARTRYTNYYFRSGGKANGSAGDGSLDMRAPRGSEPADTYVYDPDAPVPTKGGNLMFKPLQAGPFDQSATEQRKDVLIFSTPPLERDVEVSGPLSVTLYAASSAPDTDFTAKLTDVHPDGKSYNLADGIIRARYRNSFEKPELMTSGQVYKFEISLWSTSNLFRKGHRIRVAISSSNFPRFDRNPNTGGKFGDDQSVRTASQ
jgi:putative CocE/NonD family hydrolase